MLNLFQLFIVVVSFTANLAHAQQEHFPDQAIEEFKLESQRANLIDGHRRLVDRYNNLLNKIALVRGVATKEKRPVNIPKIVGKNLRQAQSVLARSSLLGTLKNKQRDSEKLDPIGAELDQIESLLRDAEKSWYSDGAAKDPIEMMQNSECIRKAAESGNPITQSELNSKISPLTDCLNAQKISFEGNVLTYDGLKPLEKMPALVKVNAMKPSPTPTATPSPSKTPLTFAEKSASKPADLKGGKIDKDAKAADIRISVDTPRKGNAVDADKIDNDKLKADKNKSKDDAVAALAVVSKPKELPKPKISLADFKKARDAQQREKEKKFAQEHPDLVKPVKEEPLPTPAEVAKNSISKTKLSAQDEKILLNAKLRSGDAIAKDNLAVVKAVVLGKKSTADYGALLIEGEVFDSKFADKDKIYNVSLEKYLKLKTKYKAFVAGLGNLSYKEKVLAVAKELNKDLLFKYTRDNARIIDFMLGSGSNCDGESRMILSVLHETGLMDGDKDHIFGVQVFSDHVQPVLYDKRDKSVLNLVANVKAEGPVTPIAKPELFFHGYLRTHGIESPVKDVKDLVLVQADPALAKKANELQGNGVPSASNPADAIRTNSNLDLEILKLSGGVAFDSEGGGRGSGGRRRIPKFATIRFGDGSMDKKGPGGIGGGNWDGDFTGGAFDPDDYRDESKNIQDDGTVPFLEDKAKDDLADVLTGEDFQDFVKVLANPTLLKNPRFTPQKVKRMTAALAKANEINSVPDKYFIGKPTEDQRKSASYTVRGSQSDYLRKLWPIYNDKFTQFFYKNYNNWPSFEFFGPKQWTQVESFSANAPMRDFQLLTMGIQPSESDNRSLRYRNPAERMASDFIDAHNMSFETSLTRTKKLEKVGKTGGNEDAKEVKRSDKHLPLDLKILKLKEAEKTASEQAVSSTENAERDRPEKRAYGIDDKTGTRNKPDPKAGWKRTQAETFADYIMAYISSGKTAHFEEDPKFADAAVEEGYKNGVLIRWTPLLSEELRKNDKEESIELMQWFVERGYEQINRARRDEKEPETPTTVAPIGTAKDEIAQDLARLYAHYYRKLQAIGVRTSAKASEAALKEYEKLTEEYDE